MESLLNDGSGIKHDEMNDKLVSLNAIKKYEG